MNEDLNGLHSIAEIVDSVELIDVSYDSLKLEIRIGDRRNKKVVLSQALDRVLDEVFLRLDVDADGLLDFTELNSFMLLSEGSELEPKLFEWLVGTFDSSQQTKLTRRGFKDAQLFMFCKVDADERREAIMQDLAVFGYDSELNLISARAVSVSIHGELNYDVEAIDYDPAAYQSALKLPITHMGSVTEYEGPVRLYIHKAGDYGVSFAVENNINSSSTWKATGRVSVNLLFQLDCSGSSDVISSTNSLRVIQRIAVGESEALQHIFPKEDWGDRDWDFAFTASMKWEEGD